MKTDAQDINRWVEAQLKKRDLWSGEDRAVFISWGKAFSYVPGKGIKTQYFSENKG